MKSNSKNSQPEVKNLYSEDNIFHYVELIKKWKIFVILNVSFITLVATIIAFLLPLWFTSTASIKPTNKTGISFFSAVLRWPKHMDRQVKA